MYGASVRSTKFRVAPYDFFSLSLSLNIPPVLQMLQVFCFETLLALSLTHVLQIAATLSLHSAPPPSTVTVTVCCLEALVTLSNIHTLHSISSSRGSFSSCLSDCRHACHCPSELYGILRQTAQVLGTFLLCSLVCSSQPLKHAACAWFKTNEKYILDQFSSKFLTTETLLAFVHVLSGTPFK